MAEFEHAELYHFSSLSHHTNTTDVLRLGKRWRIPQFRCFHTRVPWLPGILHRSSSPLSFYYIPNKILNFYFFSVDQSDPITDAGSGSPPLLSFNGKADAFSLCTNTSANARVDVVFSPVTGHPHYILDDCEPISIQVITS